jgi:PTH1 family peptidyl-tRNA hydrolase
LSRELSGESDSAWFGLRKILARVFRENHDPERQPESNPGQASLADSPDTMPPSARLIVGLGNPGREYEGTRHNVGFEVIDRLATLTTIPVEDFASNALSGSGSFRGRKMILAKPTTYMNLSGLAVKSLLNKFGLSADQLLVVVDDLNLPVGKLRLRAGGGDGGHNGLQDLIERLGTDAFARLRVGIGSDFSRGGQSDYVLSPFDADQLPEIEAAYEKATKSIVVFVREGIERAMNTANRS